MAVALPELNLDCDRCQGNPRLKIENGCFKDSPIPDRWQIGEHTFQRCPRKLVTRRSIAYIKAYNWMLRNQLPGNKPWDKQSAKFIEAMDVIELEIYKDQKEEIENLKRQKY